MEIPTIDGLTRHLISSFSKTAFTAQTWNTRGLTRLFLDIFAKKCYIMNSLEGNLLANNSKVSCSSRKYKEDGTCDADRARLPFKPEKLTWEIDEDCYDIIQKQKTQAKGIADDVDMHILPFGKYHGAPGTFGKRLIKSCGVSPGKNVLNSVF
jgi:hypothetical protein